MEEGVVALAGQVAADRVDGRCVIVDEISINLGESVYMR
jgi:hypothetical protein